MIAGYKAWRGVSIAQREVPAMNIRELRRRRPLQALLPGLVAAIALLCLPDAAITTAHADAIDNAFLNAIKAKGINFSSPQDAIVAGHEVCNELDLGRQKSDVANDVMTNSGMDGYHAVFFVGVSVAAFCPRYHV
jgi:hypothetical protein